MPRFDDYLLWKSELTDGAGTGLGPEKALLVSADRLPNKGTRYAVVGRGQELPLAALAGFSVGGKRPFFLLSEAQELAAEQLLPSADCLFAPQFPELALRALVSSAAVISYSLVPAVVAIGNRIPAVVISNDPKTLWLTERMGIPCLKQAPEKAMLKALAEIFQNYSWDVPFLSASLFQEKFLKDRHAIFRPLANRFTPVYEQDQKELSVALISDKEFLPQLLGLMANLSEVAQCRLNFEILALDAATEEFVLELNQYRNVTLTRFEDLWAGLQVGDWSMRDKALRSKSRFLLRLVRHRQEPVFYFDCDLHFKRCPSHLLTEFQNNSLLLFPNWNDSPLETRQYGIFNAGLIGARPGCERFLEVWAQFCYEHYEAQGPGYFVDQGFLDLVPLYMDDFKVYRRGDENAARWNQATHEDQSPVRSFHASQPDAKGFFAEKVLWDQLQWIFRRDEASVVSQRRWRLLLYKVWREHSLSLSRWYRLRLAGDAHGFGGWLNADWATKFLVYGPGRHVLSAVAWLRRKLLAEHRKVNRSFTDRWVAEQQLAIRETTAQKRAFIPSMLPFELPEVGLSESITLPNRSLEIH